VKKAKDWLNQKGITYQTRHIVDERPNREEIIDFHKKSGLEIKNLFNTSGLKYKELGLKDKIKTTMEDDLYDILASDGMLVKRPILTDGHKVLIGFKEKDWEEVFADYKE
jgi:arsenate reductase